MESDVPDQGMNRGATPEEAREALRGLHADRVALAERVRAPWWYHPVLGVVVGAFVASTALSSTSARSTLVTFGCVALVLLTVAYKRATGFSVSGAAGPRSRARMLVVLAIVLLLFVVSMTLVATGNAGWVTATVVAAFASVVVGGRSFERVHGEELRGGR